LRRPIYKPTAAYGHFGRTGPGSPGSARTAPLLCAKPRLGFKRQRRRGSRRASIKRRISSTLARYIAVQLQQSESNNFAFEEHHCGYRGNEKGDVKDISLADAGKRKIEWAAQQMPVLESFASVCERAAAEGIARVSLLHVTSEPRTSRLLCAMARGSSAVRVESAFHAR